MLLKICINFNYMFLNIMLEFLKYPSVYKYLNGEGIFFNFAYVE